MDDSLPGGHGSQPGAILIDGIPVVFTAASVDVDLVGAKPASALPDKTTDPEDNDDGQGEVRLEETFGIVEPTFDGADGDKKLFAITGQYNIRKGSNEEMIYLSN